MKSKTVFLCTNCGNESPKWSGRCPSCGQWNTLEEYTPSPISKSTGSTGRSVGVQPKRLREIHGDETLRFTTGMGELDRVLGGGAVRGSLVLVSGAPGIGRSVGSRPFSMSPARRARASLSCAPSGCLWTAMGSICSVRPIWKRFWALLTV